MEKHNKIILPKLPEKIERLIKSEEENITNSLQLLKADQELDVQLSLYELAMDLVYSYVKDYKNKNADELTLQYIGIRLFNSFSVAFQLTLKGYYQISYSVQRDIVEVAFLLDYFNYFPSKISDWKSSTNTERQRNYGPKVIRDILDSRDKLTNKAREKRYKAHCEYATHVSFSGNRLIAPNNRGEIGSFFNEKFLKMCFRDLIENVLYSASLFILNFKDVKDKNILMLTHEFLKKLSNWFEKRFNTKTNIDFNKIEEVMKLL